LRDEEVQRVALGVPLALRVFVANDRWRFMLKIAIIMGSTRPGRNCEAVSKWAHDIARKRTDAEFELIDLAKFELPLLDEPVATVTAQVGLSLFTDFKDFSAFKPAEAQEQHVGRMLDQLIAWSGALSALRKKQAGNNDQDKITVARQYFEFFDGFKGQLESIRHDYDSLRFIPAGEYLAVEGTSSGRWGKQRSW
jgi:hypothetical protein